MPAGSILWPGFQAQHGPQFPGTWIIMHVVRRNAEAEQKQLHEKYGFE
jgi:hypothetical protein